MRDAIGERGQLIFAINISEFDGLPTPRFRPAFLGDKWPGVDFIVELEGASGFAPYFFVQVRATALGYTQKEQKLRVGIGEAAVQRLSSYPAPVYLVGVDVAAESAYLLCANEKREALSGLSTAFPLNAENRAVLWREVIDFWREMGAAHRMPERTAFADAAWR
jgi:hypothetical protein